MFSADFPRMPKRGRSYFDGLLFWAYMAFEFWLWGILCHDFQWTFVWFSLWDFTGSCGSLWRKLIEGILRRKHGDPAKKLWKVRKKFLNETWRSCPIPQKLNFNMQPASPTSNNVQANNDIKKGSANKSRKQIKIFQHCSIYVHKSLNMNYTLSSGIIWKILLNWFLL